MCRKEKLPKKEKHSYGLKKQKIQQPEFSSFRSKKTITNRQELRVTNLAILKGKAKLYGFKA